jgi:hypothetical protein
MMPTHVLPPNPLLANFLAPSLTLLSQQSGRRNLQLQSHLTYLRRGGNSWNKPVPGKFYLSFHWVRCLYYTGRFLLIPE